MSSVALWGSTSGLPTLASLGTKSQVASASAASFFSLLLKYVSFCFPLLNGSAILNCWSAPLNCYIITALNRWCLWDQAAASLELGHVPLVNLSKQRHMTDLKPLDCTRLHNTISVLADLSALYFYLFKSPYFGFIQKQMKNRALRGVLPRGRGKPPTT